MDSKKDILEGSNKPEIEDILDMPPEAPTEASTSSPPHYEDPPPYGPVRASMGQQTLFRKRGRGEDNQIDENGDEWLPWDPNWGDAWWKDCKGSC